MIWSMPALAEVKVIEADYSYVLGDNDSRIDARRIAVQEAKRKALEHAGTYVESLTEVRSIELRKDEVRAYTAGLIETEIVADEMRGTAEHPEVYIRTRSTIDSDTLQASIQRYHETEELKEQLQASAKENSELKKERDRLVKQLAGSRNEAAAEATRKKIAAVLTKEETNEDMHRIAKALAFPLGDSDEPPRREITAAEMDNAFAVLERVIRTNPRNQRARCLLSTLLRIKGDHEGAEREARAAIRLNPSGPVPHMQLAVLLRERGDNVNALKEFHFVERLRPHHLMMLYYTGITLRDMKRCGLSIQYLQRFLKDPRAGKFHAKREQALKAINECGGARGGHQRRVRYN
jgi:Flp pilus assembly protein TadD